MARKRHLAKVIALAAGTLPFLSAGLAGAAVTSPAADDSWYSGTTHSITWAAETGVGTAALSLYNGTTQIDANPAVAGMQDITTGLVAATATTFSWAIPLGVSGTGLTIKLHGDTGGTPWAGTEVVSDAFDIVATGVSAVTPTGDVDVAVTSTHAITWTDTGPTGDTVNIDLLRNDGGTGPTTTAIAKKLAKSTVCNASTHACSYNWVVAAKTALDTTTGTYKIRVTPVIGAAAKSSAVFSVVDRSFSFTEWTSNLSVKAGEPVKIAWTATGDLGTLAITATPSGTGALPITLTKKVDATDGSFTWYPTVAQAGKTYTVTLTSTIKDASKAAFTDTSTHTVAVAVPTILNLNTLVGPVVAEGATVGTSTLGRPITVSWNFGEVTPAAGDPAPALAALPVDIVLLDSANKATKIATGELGGFDNEGIATRTFTFRPSGKLAAGNYTVKATVAGTTDAAFTKTSAAFTLAAPTTLTVEKPLADASIERGGSVSVEWTLGGKSELPVNINLLDTTTNKAVALAKAVVGVEGDGKGKHAVTIPAKTVAGTNYKIQVISADLPTLKTEVAVAITTPTLAVTFPKGTGSGKDTLNKGLEAEITWTLGTASTLPVKVDIIKAADAADPKAKAVAVVTTGKATVAGSGTVAFTPTAKITTGDYIVRMVAADISATAVLSDPFTIESADISAVTPPTDAKAGDTVAIGWTLLPAATDTAKIELFSGSTLVAKFGTIAKTATATAGTGTYSWKIPAALAAGTYSVKVTSLSDATATTSSSTFSIAAAPGATTTTTAVPTTTAAPTTTTTIP
jgi:hypothetical protein